ncbi:MAG: hypothetical protein R3322_13535 [Kiloniellales bacterium]|jgi:hypothetical protein|nr:hypothetical protein [Kiloniellales bacterium]
MFLTVLLTIFLAMLALAACAGDQPAESDLRLTCQLSKCVCAAPERVFLAGEPPQEVQWTSNGDAYCPAGYSLKLAEE